MADSPREDRVAPLVLHATDNGVSWITLNRPEAMNAVAPEQRERVIELLAAASAEPRVRAVVLTGTGRAFCAGADLRRGQGGEPTEPVAGDAARTIRRGAQALIAAVLDCEKPVIAAVNGVAAGIGAHLAFACDLVIAAEDARFIEVFVRRGLVPDGGGTYLLPRLVGAARAKELMFFGDDLSAAGAERLGLVNRVVSPQDLEKTTRSWAERLAAGPTRALALTKQLVNASLDADRATAFAAEAAAQEINMTTADAREGVRAFAERREPVFRGR
ncbi:MULTISPECIES: enoyl-CoA hydratase/isomerase family protein [Streptomycetaceae]|uniref:Putative oxidoreductase n=1 Tax=Streptantibioticus cattleyicolor (strain ATCC 35852 / DSM 46488 / JCM 4925 / NBRC 14057 / NRRL 8057) TaxID=1003195 RepID=F8JZ56_STREN|nr:MULTISPECIES: enoyl-CoA hydratase-related protein [Streptomycetaceae]AEW94722.1 putative oxidoreductase [Streptantibioticus cattleyicolor NRRL 8057 = DSM 46488]MYS59353.1 enoyl-CoA hydratase/isomerase family protein [Streptomyces sp. SID5468]CCB75078.1 putative enoyl-CoA hydratase [Streptantibioticus cattleyicolor NRRL 8057 = DSM 46488]